LLWATLILVALLLLGALIIWQVDKWRKRVPQLGPNAGDQLSHFRKLYEQGDISAEEFARIRNLLTDRMMKAMEQPAPAGENSGPDASARQPPQANGPRS
jgi:hypothetical protein